VQAGLRAEVVVEGSDCDPGAGRDVVHGHLVDGVRAEELLGRTQQ
jgi:hypothetical protein